MRKNIIFFSGETQFENTGDVLINKVLIDLIRENGDIIVDDKKMTEAYIKGLTLEKKERAPKSGFDLYLYKKALQALFSFGRTKVYFIVGPPGHLMGSSKFGRAAKTFLASFKLLPLRLFGVKLIRIGFSIGPIGKAFGRIESFRARFINYYGVRDDISLALCRKIGISKATFFPDLAWFYKPEFQRVNADEKRIIITFRNTTHISGGGANPYLAKLKEHLARLCQFLTPNYRIEIVYQVAMDRTFCEELYNELRSQIQQISFHATQVTLENAEDIFSGAAAIITNRLHAALLAYKYGALPIILTAKASHHKIIGIFQHAGIEDMIIDLDEDYRQNTRTIQSSIDDKALIMNKIDTVERDYIAYGKKTFDGIFNR